MKSRSGGHANDAGTFGGPGAESARDGSTRSGGGGGGGGGTRSWVGCPRFSSIAALGVAVICLLLVALSTQHLLLFQLAWPQVVPTGVWHDGGGAPQWLPPYAATGTARPMTQLTVCPCGACSVDTGERWFDFSAVAQGHDVTLQWLAEDTGEEVLVATNPCGRLDNSFLGELAGTPSLVRVCVCVCVCGGGACARFVCRWLCLSPTSFIPTDAAWPPCGVWHGRGVPQTARHAGEGLCGPAQLRRGRAAGRGVRRRVGVRTPGGAGTQAPTPPAMFGVARGGCQGGHVGVNLVGGAPAARHPVVVVAC